MKITQRDGGTLGRIVTITNASVYGVNMYVGTDATNCKLSYIHGAGAMERMTDAEKKEVMIFLLGLCKGAVILNTTKKVVADFIAANYDIYYYEDVPIGYSKGYQYHICFKNNINVNGNCRKPDIKKVTVLPRVVNEGKGTERLTRVKIEVALRAILKAKRRKDDFVDDFIKSL